MHIASRGKKDEIRRKCDEIRPPSKICEKLKKRKPKIRKELADDKAKAKGKTEDYAETQMVTIMQDKAKKGPKRDGVKNSRKVCGQKQNQIGDIRSEMTDLTEKWDAKERRTARRTKRERMRRKME